MKTRMIHALGLFFLASIFAGTAFADEASVKASMKARFAKVMALKDGGAVGEGADGMLHARAGLDEDGGKLIAAENTDRKTFYEIKAKQAGGGWALIRNTTHQGAMGYYTEQLARRGLAGIAVVTNPPNMAHPGTRAAGVHNSPISFAVPGPEDRGPLVLDMATSIAAFGKVMVASDKGESIPDTWALDEHGNPTTDPAAARTLRPAGEYKGYGLALLFECFTGLMAANPLVSPNILDNKTGTAQPGAQNSFLCAVDVSMFGDLVDYRQEVEDLIRAEKSLPRQDGVDEVFVPGDPELKTLEERTREGVPMPPGTWAKIEVAAQRFGLELPRKV